jgi:hypothetical protein
MKCYTVEYDAHGSTGLVRNRIGSFETLADAQRYVHDVFDDGKGNPEIKPTTANAVHEWRRPTYFD